MGKLEADNRRLKRLCLVALVGLLVILVSGQARNTRKVEAEEFLLEEAAGTVKGELSLFLGDPCLQLYVAAQKSGVMLCAGDIQGTFLRLADRSDRSTIKLGVKFPGPQLEINDKEGGSVSLGATSLFGGPHMMFVSSSERVGLVDLGVDSSGASMTLADAKGYKAVLGNVALESPATGKTSETSAASLVLFDKNKKVLWSAP